MDNEKKENPKIATYAEGYAEGKRCILCDSFIPFAKAPCVCKKCKELWKLLKEKFL